MKLDEKLTELSKGFSNKQKKLLGRIEPITNRQVAISLISLQGVEKTSQAEIEVIANIISQFKPLEIVDIQESPRHIFLCGNFKKHYVYIEPQYKVLNINPKAQPWSIDLVLKLQRKIGSDLVEIASIGIEYDGHVSHYVESNIKSTYKRDVEIIAKNGIQSLRISPELWKKNFQDIKKAIKKYFEHQIRIIENVQLSTMNALDSSQNDSVYDTTCPVCLGESVIALELCPACSGVGRVSCKTYINLDDYNIFDCPECQHRRVQSKSCIICIGKGYISREKALEIAKERA
ncbi:hypothetical protein [Vibrio alginolyticus]|uniref:hypothetical protein n=1 Tax=Vibrio alginolyticus TaxID=663 RepID=UPI00215B7739|nr:hypothetical protein [Vibrio alginolyticus]EGQ8156570.1 hypothetical protein [Vibrio alginolyticus]EGQ8488599.1 hypothetical protein [Vibrio alginolyticus]EKP4442040.1 hypothetical protein [Vibrio alginolyticus]ELB2798672.1 hypothetical protein [Vibrio alginolyticus]MCR9571595.1 hypothetical protein [Vibrio alginolyticus]